jgi:alkaline phosphatase
VSYTLPAGAAVPYALARQSIAVRPGEGDTLTVVTADHFTKQLSAAQRPYDAVPRPNRKALSEHIGGKCHPRAASRDRA